MRMVVDLSHLDESRWVQLMGESGHALGAPYHDQFDLWRTGKTLPMRWDQSTIRRESTHQLRLKGGSPY
jgi:penicillin amidase